MDSTTILILMLGILLALMLLVLAGLGLTVRSYTLLLDVIRYFGSLVARIVLAQRPAPTTSSKKTEPGTQSAPPEDTHTTRE